MPYFPQTTPCLSEDANKFPLILSVVIVYTMIMRLELGEERSAFAGDIGVVEVLVHAI